MKRLYSKKQITCNLCSICVILLCLFLNGCFYSEDESNVDIEYSISRNQAIITNQLVNVIKSKDTKSMLKFIASEDRVELEAVFNDKESPLYKVFFGMEQSFYIFMQKAQDLDYQIVAYSDRPNDVIINAFDVLFYDKGKINSLKGLKLAELRELGYDKKILVFFLSQPASGHKPAGHFKEQWYMDITGHGSYFLNADDEYLNDYYPIK